MFDVTNRGVPGQAPYADTGLVEDNVNWKKSLVKGSFERVLSWRIAPYASSSVLLFRSAAWRFDLQRELIGIWAVGRRKAGLVIGL